MDWLIGELLILAGPVYFFLQLLRSVRYRGRWLVLSLVPLLLMMPLGVHAGMAFAAEIDLWPMLLILAAPLASIYLLGLAVVKASIAERTVAQGAQARDRNA